MAIDPLSVWKSTLAELPAVADNSWSETFAGWYHSRILSIETNPSQLIPSGFVFNFQESVFAAQLSSLTPVDNSLAGITGFANAWEAALLASTAVLAPGSAIPPPTPKTIFSLINSTVIDPSSIAAGKAKILELVTAPAVSDTQNSEFPEKFRDATLLLTITTQGLDSQTPPDGPQPLMAAAVSLI